MTTGTDDLIRTLVCQHGLERSIDAARAQVQAIKDERRSVIWKAVLCQLKGMRA